MHRILAITNQKGGVGKTTTSVNLAASLAATKRRVLLVDIDPQGNATMGCGIDKRTVERSTTDVLLGDSDAASALRSVDYSDFKVMPANQDLVAADVEMMGKPGCESRLRDALQPVLSQFDIVLIDCPPALNMLTVNALVAAEGVLIPMQCEYYALEGLTALVNTIEQIKAGPNPKAGDRRHPAHHVRSAQQSGQRSFGAADRAFRRQSVSHHHSAQRAAGGSAELRQAGSALR